VIRGDVVLGQHPQRQALGFPGGAGGGGVQEDLRPA
jgi:hypothetical protein